MAKRTPVAPNGCPMESDPPHKLNLSMSGLPTFSERPMYFCANQSESNAFKFAKICPLKKKKNDEKVITQSQGRSSPSLFNLLQRLREIPKRQCRSY